ncbi:uncharacterized protein LOC108954367 [Eucalyptus grandis]|uniref:uncharacterized protein LOC108954367 n=1 Tax=Eucalyptus grandis TaxID=71139 RepID=UPI00192EC6C8|nr:uncharacterized protein LOC108954367 [Eucalyptus grandis]
MGLPHLWLVGSRQVGRYSGSLLLPTMMDLGLAQHTMDKVSIGIVEMGACVSLVGVVSPMDGIPTARSRSSGEESRNSSGRAEGTAESRDDRLELVVADQAGKSSWHGRRPGARGEKKNIREKQEEWGGKRRTPSRRETERKRREKERRRRPPGPSIAAGVSDHLQPPPEPRGQKHGESLRERGAREREFGARGGAGKRVSSQRKARLCTGSPSLTPFFWNGENRKREKNQGVEGREKRREPTEATAADAPPGQVAATAIDASPGHRCRLQHVSEQPFPPELR